MLSAFDATGDEAYRNYAYNRFNFLAEVAPHFRKLADEGKDIDPQMRQILMPHALDDAGAVCASMIKAKLKDTAFPTEHSPAFAPTRTACGWTICLWESLPLH